MKIGIEATSFFVPSLYLEIKDLAEKRGIEPAKLEKGLERKMKLFRENPSSTSLNTQIEMLNKAITSYSN